MIPVIAVIALIAVSSYVYANQGGSGKFFHRFNPERHAQMQEVFESEDYQAWTALLPEDCPLLDDVTEENFDQYIEMHNLMMDGEFEAAKVLSEELGIDSKGCFGIKGFKKWGMHGGMMQKRLEDKNGDGFCDYQDKE